MHESVNKQIQKLADYCISEGIQNTGDGLWSISYDELHEHFDASVTDTNSTGQLLREELQQRKEVADCIMTEDSIEIAYHLEHCPNCYQGGITGAMNLFSLIGCNLEDIHLIDVDEEHDVATIVELNQNTLTNEGKTEWSDVLSAKVVRIYDGACGTQIDLSGSSAERIRDFSYMLAGYCSAENYDKWVAPDDSPKQSLRME
jgi:hypothetical protein